MIYHKLSLASQSDNDRMQPEQLPLLWIITFPTFFTSFRICKAVNKSEFAHHIQRVISSHLNTVDFNLTVECSPCSTFDIQIKLENMKNKRRKIINIPSLFLFPIPEYTSFSSVSCYFEYQDHFSLCFVFLDFFLISLFLFSFSFLTSFFFCFFWFW